MIALIGDLLMILIGLALAGMLASAVLGAVPRRRPMARRRR